MRPHRPNLNVIYSIQIVGQVSEKSSNPSIMQQKYYEHLRDCSVELRHDFPDWSGKEVLAEARRRPGKVNKNLLNPNLLSLTTKCILIRAVSNNGSP